MKLAVIVHAFYPELRPEIDACLANIDEPYDLFVTDASDGNRGFDIGPFLRVLDGLDLSRYTHVLKLHTKRDVTTPCDFNGMSVSGPTWRNELLSIVRTPAAWAETKQRIAAPGVGMVAAAACILDRRATPCREEKAVYDAAVREAARRFGRNERCFRHADFVGGTMFLARSEALRPLQGRFRPDEFEVSDPLNRRSTFAHVAERLIGFSVTAAGLRIECPSGDLAQRRRGFRWAQLWCAVKAFLYRDCMTSQDYRMIKVCKIMVWHRKVGVPRTKYDLVLGMGPACSCSQVLRKAGLQLLSFPFDWTGYTHETIQYPGDMPLRVDDICAGMKHWFEREDFVYYHRALDGQDLPFNLRTTGIFPHDFHSPEDLEKNFDKVKAKYDRRIARLLERLGQSKNVLLVRLDAPPGEPPTPDEDCRYARRKMVETYVGTNFDLVHFRCEKGRSFAERTDRELEPGFREIAFDYHDYTPGKATYEVDLGSAAKAISLHAAVRDYRTSAERRRSRWQTLCRFLHLG